MTILTIFKNAIADIVRRPYPVLWLWMGNLLISLALIAPVFALADADLSHSLMGERLLEGTEAAYLMDGAGKYMNLLPLAIPLVAVTALCYLLLSTFLTGGSLTHLAAQDRARTTAAVFFSDCGRLFLPLVRLLILALVCYGLVLGGFALLLDAVFGSLTSDALTEWSGLITGNVKVVLLLVLFSVLNLIFDYAKVTMVLGDDPRALRALGSAWTLVRRNFGAAWSLYLLCAVLFGAVSLVYLEISRIIPDNAVFLVFVAFLLHQVFIAVRCGVRLIFFASEIGLVRTR